MRESSERWVALPVVSCVSKRIETFDHLANTSKEVHLAVYGYGKTVCGAINEEYISAASVAESMGGVEITSFIAEESTGVLNGAIALVLVK